MSTELKEHKLIHDCLDELLPLIRSAKADQSKFDACKIKDILERLKAPLARSIYFLAFKPPLTGVKVPTLGRRSQAYCTGKHASLRS